MITSALILIPLRLLSFLVDLLPTASLPAGVSSAISSTIGYTAGWNQYFPIDTLLAVLGLALSFRFALWGLELSVRLYGLVRGTR